MGLSHDASFEVQVKTAFIKYEWRKMQIFLSDWGRENQYQIKEESGNVTLIIGNSGEIQLILKGRKGRKYVRFYSGEVLGHRMDEKMLSDLLDWICNVPNGTLGLIITKNGSHSRPVVIKNGQLYDETRMMDILWGHYSATRVRESRRMEDVYYFLRDVPRF